MAARGGRIGYTRDEFAQARESYDDAQFPASALIDFAGALLVSGGVPDTLAQIVAESLVAANLRGVDSHGIQMLLPYLDQLGAGTMDGKAEGSPLSESGGCMVYDGGNGLGQVVADRSVTHALRLVRAWVGGGQRAQFQPLRHRRVLGAKAGRSRLRIHRHVQRFFRRPAVARHRAAHRHQSHLYGSTRI